jgi:hypothetical protein
MQNFSFCTKYQQQFSKGLFNTKLMFLDPKVKDKKMAGNLDFPNFLKGMALESAQLAVNYVKGEGENTSSSSPTSNIMAVSDNN